MGAAVLDRVDTKIIAALDQNSRQSNKAIAKKTQTNEHVIAYRIQKLISEGIIQTGYEKHKVFVISFY
jgi:DNA-binding Lrp family transcriptional regulator